MKKWVVFVAALAVFVTFLYRWLVRRGERQTISAQVEEKALSRVA